MTTEPVIHEDKIGKPQILARFLELDGRQVLVRLQKPFEEAEYTDTPKRAIIKADEHGIREVPDESHIRFGTALIVETWCDATKSVITTFIKKPNNFTEEAFSLGVRYMMNNASDSDIVEVIKLKKLDQQIKFQMGKDDSELILPVPPKTPPRKKKKT